MNPKHPALYALAVALLGVIIGGCAAPAQEGQTTRIFLRSGTSQPIDLGIEGVSPILSCEMGVGVLTFQYKDSRPPLEERIERGRIDTTSGRDRFTKLTNESKEDESNCTIKKEVFPG